MIDQRADQRPRHKTGKRPAQQHKSHGFGGMGDGHSRLRQSNLMEPIAYVASGLRQPQVPEVSISEKKILVPCHSGPRMASQHSPQIYHTSCCAANQSNSSNKLQKKGRRASGNHGTDPGRVCLSLASLQQHAALHMRRLGEHVHRLCPLDPVARVEQRAAVLRERRRIARDVDEAVRLHVGDRAQ